MAFSIQKIQDQASKSGGFAMQHQFVVVLPRVPNTIVESRDINVLCRQVNIPGRQMASVNRIIGVKGHELSYGFVEDDVTMEFYVMNNWGIRSYFEEWQNLVLNQNSKYVGYVNDYAKTVRIHALKKGLDFNFDAVRKARNVESLLDLLGIDIDIDFNFSQKTNYGVELEGAYPKTINAIQLTNDLDGLLSLSVTFTHRQWRRI
tara:strand:+ start:1269 stop:1880 length:612 start_codon:yes stop_codon:yes gene_type:complete